MENCLVTKLNASVGGNIPRLGCVVFTIAPNSSLVTFTITAKSGTTTHWTLSGPAYFTNSAGTEDYGQTITNEVINRIKFEANAKEPAYLVVDNKYNWQRFEMNINPSANRFVTFNLEELDYCTKLYNIDATQGVKALGSLKNWKDRTYVGIFKCILDAINNSIYIDELPNVILNNSSLGSFVAPLRGGSIYNLSKSIKHSDSLTECGSFGNLTGTLDLFAVAQRENGNTSGSIHTSVYGVKIGQEKYAIGSNYGLLTWTSDKMYAYHSNNFAMTQITKVFYNGYTEEEIQQNIATGGIWEGISRNNIVTFTIAEH